MGVAHVHIAQDSVYTMNAASRRGRTGGTTIFFEHHYGYTGVCRSGNQTITGTWPAEYKIFKRADRFL